MNGVVSYSGRFIHVFNFLHKSLREFLLAWYEWYPDYAKSFDDPININSGDEIHLTVTATSSTTGVAIIENLTQEQSVKQEISSTYPLCQANAEWIVEDFTSNDQLVPFNDFTTVTFEEAYAEATDGGYWGTGVYTPLDATTIFLVQDNKVITDVDEEVLEVTIRYNATGSQ